MKRAFLVLVAASVAGCFANRARMSECQGTVMATVRNNWNYPVDVYADMRGGSGFILGEVRAGGREEFSLPEGATGVTFRWRSTTVSRPTSADLTTSYACR